MKTILYSACLLLLLNACRHQSAATASSASDYTTKPAGTTTTTTTTQTVSQQGDVTIVTNDPSTSATIVITNPPDTVVTTVVAPAQDTAKNLYRVTVSFISKGAGIDHKSQETFENWLKNQPKHPAYDMTRWGREGETNYCLKLTELSTREQEIFVRDLRTLLSDKELVFVSEYAECKGTKVN